MKKAFQTKLLGEAGFNKLDKNRTIRILGFEPNDYLNKRQFKTPSKIYNIPTDIKNNELNACVLPNRKE
ncbi:7925_t:CDS:2 [Gigaspora rosea]|nr:7925_t:CDS:2 [Gigaspora rosea]